MIVRLHATTEPAPERAISPASMTVVSAMTSAAVAGDVSAFLAADKQFRNSFDAALSYFVGGNPSYPEDKGFAIKPWTKVRWQNVGITNNACNMAVAMGNYYFTSGADGAETKVEYTFGYIRDPQGALKIVVHQSSVPYNGA